MKYKKLLFEIIKSCKIDGRNNAISFTAEPKFMSTAAIKKQNDEAFIREACEIVRRERGPIVVPSWMTREQGIEYKAAIEAHRAPGDPNSLQPISVPQKKTTNLLTLLRRVFGS